MSRVGRRIVRAALLGAAGLLALPAGAADAVPAPAAAPSAAITAQAPTAPATAASSAALPAPPASGTLTEAQITAAVQAIRAEAQTGRTRKTHVLRWKADDEKRERKTREPDSSWDAWVRNLARWLADTSRLLVWLGGLTGLAIFLVVARQLWHGARDARALAAAVAVSHVRDLDVRPESLPDDVGAAARALWQAGREQAALSLLYRGALSRLIHRHAVPVEAASTEGECLALARRHAGTAAQAYFARLVRAWQAATYGAQAPTEAIALALCDGFAAGLDATAPGSGP